MSFNGSGLFEINTSGQPVVDGTTIDATVFNALTADLATGLSNCITKDGQTTVTANIPMGANKITGLAAATARTDAANLGNVQDGTGVYVGTVGGTADVITLTPSPAITSYTAGKTFRFIASGTNTTNVTVAVSGLAAKAITKNGTTALVAGDIPSGSMVEITYDGTRFILGTIGASTTAAILETVVNAKGDILVATAADTVARKTIGLDGTVLVALAATTHGLDYQSGLMNGRPLVGGHFTATVAANALTIAIKTDAGTNPSSTSPVWVAFRSDDLTDGTVTLLSITSATSLTISSGSTLGTVSGAPSRLYVGIANDAGTLRLFIYNPLGTTYNIRALNEANLQSSTAEGGVGGADSVNVIYSGTAFTSKPITLIGYIESTQATAGTWATTPSKVHVLTKASRRTGDLVRRIVSFDNDVATGTTVLPYDDTVPQNTEGDQYMTAATTPTSNINLLDIQFSGVFAHSASNNCTVALFQDSTASALAATSVTTPNADYTYQMSLRHVMQAGTTSSTTLKIRAGGTAGTMTFNGAAGARKYGGVISSYLSIDEIFV